MYYYTSSYLPLLKISIDIILNKKKKIFNEKVHVDKMGGEGLVKNPRLSTSGEGGSKSA